jgi:hypothetical protein
MRRRFLWLALLVAAVLVTACAQPVEPVEEPAGSESRQESETAVPRESVAEAEEDAAESPKPPIKQETGQGETGDPDTMALREETGDSGESVSDQPAAAADTAAETATVDTEKMAEEPPKPLVEPSKPAVEPQPLAQELPAVQPAEEPEDTSAVQAEPGALLITGTGLERDLVLNPSEWRLNQSAFTEKMYSSNNNFGFHKIWKVKGYDLMALLQQAGLKTDRDYPVTFIASDGVTVTQTVSSLNNRYYYAGLTPEKEQRVVPMIGFYRAELYDSLDPQPPVSWNQRRLTEQDKDDRGPRLYVGQQQKNPSDVNQPFFIRDLMRIVVGEER